MAATDHDLAALLAAIDAGDDSALPALADWLEERGDARAAGLRGYSLSLDAPRGRNTATGWAFERIHQLFGWTRFGLDRHLYLALRRTGCHRHEDRIAGVEHLFYPTRSAALLALASALAPAGA